MLTHLAKIFKTITGNEDHQAILDAVDQQLQGINSDTDQIISEMNINIADTNWLDLWGNWFGLSRSYQESDDDFRQRIFNVLLDPTVTIPAIVMITKRILGQDAVVTVYEPYHDVRYFNISTFSGSGHYEDGTYYRIGVIDVIVNKPITTQLVTAINNIRAAGVLVTFTYEAENIVDLSDNDNPSDYLTYYYSKMVQNLPINYAFDQSSPSVFSGIQQIYRHDDSVPFSLEIDASNEPAIKLSWSSILGAESYVVYRNYSPISGNLTTTSFIDVQSNYGESDRYYQVFAIMPDGEFPSQEKSTIEYSGLNLLVFSSIKYWNDWPGYVSGVGSPSGYAIYEKDGSSDWCSSLYYDESGLVAGQVYTFSIYLKGTPGDVVAVGFKAVSNKVVTITSSDWKQYYYTFTWESNSNTNFVFDNWTSGTKHDWWFSCYKLETGSVVSAWSPSPYDGSYEY